MATSNATILDRIRLKGSWDYQQRVPQATQATVAKVADLLFDPMNGDIYNEFINGLVNLIGMQIVHNKQWDNPLATFKRATINYGNTIEEAAPQWIKAHSYEQDAEELLKNNPPEFQVAFHSVDRKDRYDISINRDQLRAAFRDEYGLNRLIDSALQVPRNSDNYDEYLLTVNQMVTYCDKYGYYNEQLAYPVDEATSKAALKKLRSYVTKLQWPTTTYTPAPVKVPVFAAEEDLIFIVESDAMASLDVDALAMLFNLEKGDIKERIIVVPEIPIDGMWGALTTTGYFLISDYVYETTSFFNPQTLATNYYLHHWEIISTSPFVPFIGFSTNEASEIPEVEMTATGLQLVVEPENDTVKPGDTVQLITKLEGSIAPQGYSGPVELLPDSCTFALSASLNMPGKDEDADDIHPVQLNSATYVDRNNVLHIQKTGLQEGVEITIVATSTYINPTGATNLLQADTSVTIG